MQCNLTNQLPNPLALSIPLYYKISQKFPINQFTNHAHIGIHYFKTNAAALDSYLFQMQPS